VFICCICLLRSQELSTDQLSVVYTGLIVSRLLSALSACGVFACAADAARIDALLKRAYKWSFSKDVVTLSELLNKSGISSFQKCIPHHTV